MDGVRGPVQFMYLLGVFITNSHLLKADIPKEELFQILEALILKIKLSKFMNHFESGEIKQSCWRIFVSESLCPDNKPHREKQIKLTNYR